MLQQRSRECLCTQIRDWAHEAQAEVMVGLVEDDEVHGTADNSVICEAEAS